VTDEQHESSAERFLRKIPAIGGLPGPAVGLIGLGIVAFAGMVLVDAVGLVLSVVFEGLGNVFTVLLLALLGAYLLDPVIDRFERAGWSRSLGIGVALGSFLVVAGLSFLLLIPYVVTEVADLSDNIDGYIKDSGEGLAAAEVWLNTKTGMDLDLRFSSMGEKLPALLDKFGAGQEAEGAGPIQAALASASRFFGGAVGLAVTWTLFPIFAFFFLRDFDELKRRLFALIPFRFRRTALEHYVTIDGKMAAFVRGQFILCCTLAVLYALGLGIFTDIDLAVLVGVLSGLLFVVPYLGTFFGLLAGTTLALLKFGVSVEVLKVWAVFGGVQLFEGAVLTPKIVGDSVGLHPVVVMLSLVVGANLFGFLGILLAVPVAAVLQVLLGTALGRYKDTSWFQQGQEEAPSVDEVP
jgi:predicted PurR-regulated permease PerM